MDFLPDWIPNIHPLVVHFPIALIVAAGVIDLVSTLMRTRAGALRAANLLYLFGTLALVAAFFSGRQAADLVFLDAEAQAVLTEHADLGTWVLWFFVGYVIVRLPISVSAFGKKLPARLILLVIGLGGIGLMTYGAHHGAELVFRHGAGVQAVEDKPVERPVVVADSGSSGPVRTPDGGWHWTPTRAAAWQTSVDWIEGQKGAVRSSLVDGGQRGDVLAFDLDSETVFFTFPDSLDGVQIDLEADLTELDGTFMVVHDLQDADNYRFASFGGGTARLGQAENGDLLVAETVDRDVVGWRSIRVVVDGGHARAYVDTELVAHGHFDAGPPAPVGLRINGTGRVALAFVTVTPTRSTSE